MRATSAAGAALNRRNSPEKDERYTPSKVVRLARECLGGIDLDPASCAQANETVRAPQIYTLEDSGLDHDWHGRVFLNPPFSKKGLFVDYLLGQEVSAAVVLPIDPTAPGWFRPIWEQSAAVISLGSSIKFGTPEGEMAGAWFATGLFLVAPRHLPRVDMPWWYLKGAPKDQSLLDLL